MEEPLIFIDSSEVLPGKLEAVKAAIAELAEFVERTETRPISYGAYFDEGQRLMTVVQLHPDSASMEHHMEAAASIFPRFRGLLEMRSMEVYGKPSDALLTLLQSKAGMLGAGRVRVHAPHAGFTRILPR